MASEVQICNLALLEFGELQITSLNDNTKEGRACKVLYPLLRDELLYAHPWNFALKRADITPEVSTSPAFEYDYAYTLPADCLRVWEFYTDSSTTEPQWEVENGLLLTNEDSEIYIRYISQVTEPGRFNPAFVACLGKKLGAALAAKLAGDRGAKIKEALIAELIKSYLPDAYRLNAVEGNRRKFAGEKGPDTFSWATEGH